MQNITSPISDGVHFSKTSLQIGAKGEAVVEIQRLLAYWQPYKGWIDGEFSPQLETAVKDWQRRVFLPEDGIVNDFTWQTLYAGAPVNMPVLYLGSIGDSVAIVQNILKITDNYWGEIHSEFDLFTDTAVRDFQRRRGLVIDGVVGTYTWWALSKVPH